MIDDDELDSAIRYWPALVALTVPVAFLIWQSSFEGSWLEMALGRWAAIFWLAVLVWLGALALALRRKQWWALIAAPLALYPIVMAFAVLGACATGDCL